MNIHRNTLYNEIVEINEKDDSLGIKGLVPGDGLIVFDESHGTFRAYEEGIKWFSAKEHRLDKGTVLVVTKCDPGTLGVVAVDSIGRFIVITHFDVLLGVVVPLTRGGR